MKEFNSKALHESYRVESKKVTRVVSIKSPEYVETRIAEQQLIQAAELKENLQLKETIASTVGSIISADEYGNQFWTIEAESLWLALRDYRSGAYELKDLTGLTGDALMMAEMDNEDLEDITPMFSKEVYDSISPYFF